MDSVDFRGQNTAVIDSYDVVPSTPAFPVSPPTPYGENTKQLHSFIYIYIYIYIFKQ